MTPTESLKEDIKAAVKSFNEATGIVPVAIGLTWISKSRHSHYQGGIDCTLDMLTDIKVDFATLT